VITNSEINGKNELGGRSNMIVTTAGRALGDVYIQDQTTPAVIAKFNRIDNVTTLAAPTVVGSKEVSVADATGIAVGSYIILYSPIPDRYYLGYVISIAGTTLTMDTPLDSILPTGAAVTSGVTNMAVDGSVTSQIFGLRGQDVLPSGVDLVFDITRIIFDVQTADPVSLSTFGDIAGGIANGLVLRKRDGEYYNIFNVKTNADIAGIMYDWTPEAATNPQQGQNGFYARLTFASQGKIGVTQRLAKGEDLEFIVQDDLSDITRFEVIAEGHIVD
jgi:hypothetical protein